MRRTSMVATAAAALVLAGGGALVLRGKAAATPPAAAPAAQAFVELAATDVARAGRLELVQGLPLTGTLKAVESAVVKSRVAGELQALTVREGDAVRRGQEIGRLDATEYQARLRQATEQAEAAAAQVEIAQRQFGNNQALVDQGFISRTALEGSASTLAGARATHRAALAAVDLARKQLDDTVLRAPLSGVVSQRLAQPGERLAVDARVVEVVDPTRLELEAPVAAADSVKVRIGQRARLQVEGAAAPVPATVARINPSAQAGTRSVPVYLSVQPTPGLRQGLFAQGRLEAGRAEGTAVPLESVRTDKPSPYLQLVEDGRVRHLKVEPGARGEHAGAQWVIVAGVAPGATVLLQHVGALREGTPARFTDAMPAAAPRSAP